MASSSADQGVVKEDEFLNAVEYGLRCVGKAEIIVKPEQLETVRHIYNGKDVFLWLPTGFGKSLCYELLPFVMDQKLGRHASKQESARRSFSIVLVVSPLVSLMIDQVTSLRKRGVIAGILSGHSAVREQLVVSASNIDEYSFLFSCPEAIVGVGKCREMLLNLSERIVAVAVDEAHCVSKWSRDFRPAYGRLHELRALVPQGIPFLAATATATPAVRREVIDKLDMRGCEIVYVTPDRPNIYYDVRERTTIDVDLQPLVHSLLIERNMAKRVIVYCRSLNMVADLYAHFLCTLGDNSHHPKGAQHISDNRLYGMYHANTASHNKEVIQKSMLNMDGVVRIVFATIALGMGVNMVGVNTIWHYGAPSTLDDYLQESGRGGRDGKQAKSIVFWRPVDAPLHRDLSIGSNAAVAAVRHYLENTCECRRVQLLQHFDLVSALPPHDPLTCCDVCAKNVVSICQ